MALDEYRGKSIWLTLFHFLHSELVKAVAIGKTTVYAEKAFWVTSLKNRLVKLLAFIYFAWLNLFVHAACPTGSHPPKPG
jgi:hypothetical protein